MFFLYEVLLYLVFIITLPVFLLVGFMRGKYLANFPARMGVYRTRRAAHDVWIHAVSVGETLAARPVVSEIVRRRPETSIVLTTTTITGQAQAKRLFAEHTVTYFPFDFGFAVKRFLEHYRPRVFAAMETEIWPNVTRLSRARGVRLILANGRISDRSMARYRAVRFLVRPILALYERILARDETDRQRFIGIGAQADRVEVTGNVKFDHEPDTTPLDVAPQLEALIGGRNVLVLGSTAEGEDEQFLPEIEHLVREHNAFVILAPRKSERFDIVAALLSTTSLRFVRRSELDANSAAEVLLLDTYGELSRLYRYGAAAFVGGSLVDHGGQNPIEPAAAGVPVCFGPHMSNFREVAAEFVGRDAAEVVGSVTEVMRFATRMFDDAELRRTRGERARDTVLRNRGASARTASRILELL